MTRSRAGLLLLRYGLPGLLMIAGAVLVAIGGGKGVVAGAGVVIAGIAVMVWMLGWLFRMSLSSNRDRDREEEARQYFTEHGHWPGEEGP